MKTMKKLVAALLVLTMVLALTATAMAACKFPVYDFVKFKKNAPAYKCVDGKATKAIVAKGSTAQIMDNYKDKWLQLRIDSIGTTRWFKAGDVKLWKGDYDKNLKVYIPYVLVVYCQGGVGMSALYDEGPTGEGYLDVTTLSCYKYIKANKGSAWMHKHPCLKYNMGLALSKGKKAKYLFRYGWDVQRNIPFYKIKYKGKVGYVSAAYTKPVK